MPISLRTSRRCTACAAILAGTFLLTVSAMAPTYAARHLMKIPLSIEASTVSTGTADLLDAAALAKGKLIIDSSVPITVNQRVTVEDPSDANTATLQSAVQMTRDDRTGAGAIVNASVDRSTVHRRTGLAVADPAGSIQSTSGKPADPVAHEGLQFKFPFDAQKQSYPYFDTTLRASYNVDFAAEDTLAGIPVYRFHQEIAPTAVGGAITLPASNWGREGTAPMTLKRFYGITRDLWVEPVSGAIVQVQQRYRQYFASAVNATDSITIIDVSPKLDAQTQAEQIERAVTYKNLIQWGTVYGPTIGGVVGLLLLAGGLFLGVTSKRQQAPTAEPELPVELELVADR
ncbi:MAG: DUF3068 domain-containing protein [Rhodococcus sp. (in: high G+C Gram-positive bacteria)]|uniref:DUF3068 domain-containing protein n=1 Tax=Rhodococcus sp. TaxID=1831 RepID=UPI003BAFF27C